MQSAGLVEEYRRDECGTIALLSDNRTIDSSDHTMIGTNEMALGQIAYNFTVPEAVC
jgi:hypothetical protein